jgi:hypothetical protein
MTSLFRTWLQAMKRKALSGARTRREAKRTRPTQFVPRLESLDDRIVPSTLTVTNNLDAGIAGAGSLRGEIVAAQSGDTIDFAPGLAGQTITLTSGELAITKSLDIEGLGADQLTISGNNASRVFDVGAGATVTIAGMTITDGLADGSSPGFISAGGGILNSGNLTLANDVLSNNQAVGDAVEIAPGLRPGGAVGGGIENRGSLTASASTFTGNQAVGFDGRSGAQAGNTVGGAIDNSGAASIADSQFTFNVGQAGSDEDGSRSASSSGGAINNAGSLTIAGSTFSHNQAVGGDNSVGDIRPGLGVGGAILSGGPIGPLATLSISGCTFDHNQAIGGNDNTGTGSVLTGPNDAFGGGVHVSGGIATVSRCTFDHNAAIAGAGAASQNGGLAEGGGMDGSNFFAPRIVDVTVSDCTFTHNSVIGGAGGTGGNGGDAWGGGLADLLGATLTVSDSIVDHNLAIGGAGGAGGNGGDGLGGGVYEDALSTLALTGATVDHNLAIGGAAGTGGSDGQGVGGGVYIAQGGVACADALTMIFANHATTNDDDVFGVLGSC